MIVSQLLIIRLNQAKNAVPHSHIPTISPPYLHHISTIYKTYTKLIQSLYNAYTMLIQNIQKTYTKHIRLSHFPFFFILQGGRYRPSTPSPSHPFIPLNPSTHPARLCLGTLPSIYNIFSHARNIILPYQKKSVSLQFDIDNKVQK